LIGADRAQSGAVALDQVALGVGHPSHSQTPRPMIHSLSPADNHGSSSVKSVTARRHVQGSRVQSVPQNIRRGPNVSYTLRMCRWTSRKG
jgi:hypothetical protein